MSIPSLGAVIGGWTAGGHVSDGYLSEIVGSASGKSGSYPLVVARVRWLRLRDEHGCRFVRDGVAVDVYRAHHVHGGNEDARNGRR